MDYGYVAYKDKLNDEYKEAFSRVELYGSLHMIDAKTDSEWMMELLDNMLLAQEAGEPVEKVVGTDIDRFCEEFFDRYTGEDRVQGIFRKLYTVVKLLFILDILDGLLFAEEESFFTGSSEMFTPWLWGITVGMLSNIVLWLIINPLFLKNKRLSSKLYGTVSIILGIVTLIVAIATGCWAEEHFPVLMNRGILMAVSGGYILIYKIIEAVKNYKKYGTVRAPKEPKTTMKDMENAVLEKELPKEWLKEFEKKNKRRVKKGKPELSYEEFMEKLVKRYDYPKRKKVIIASGCVGGLLGFVLGFGSVAVVINCFATEVSGDFFGIDLVVGIIFFLAFCIIFPWIIARINKPACERFARVKKECDEKGWTLAEYVENMESGETVISAGEEGM